jgi:hypothetical protein
MSAGEVRGSGFAVRGKRASVPRTPNPEPRTAFWLLAAAVIAAVALVAAYQVRPTERVEIGDAAHDTALVRSFYVPERQTAADGGARYRWSRGAGRIVFPGIGRGAVHLDLVMSSALNPSRTVRVLANGGAVGQATLTPVFAPYGFDVPASFMRSGSLVVTLDAQPYMPPGEQRTLGVAVQSITVRPVGQGIALPPARIALSLWIGILCVALSLWIAGVGGRGAFLGATLVAGTMACFLIGNRLFLTVDAGGVVRAGALMLAATVAVRFGFAPLCRRLGLAATARDVRWLAVIAGSVLALRFAGVLHPSIVIVDLKFHLHRLADVADRHTLLLPIQSAEFGGRTVLYAPTPYLVMLPFSWLIRDRTLLLFLFSLGIDLARFCVLWLLARRVTRDLLTANLVVLTMALMPVGWIVYSWGTFANIFAEGMLTLLFALFALAYDRLAGPRRWRWCAIFAAVICLTLLAHIGVFVLTALTVTLYFLARLLLLAVRRHRSDAERRGERRAVSLFALAGLAAALVAFALFYRFPAHDLIAGQHAAAVDQEEAATPPAPQGQRYRTGGATPDDRIGLPAVSTAHLSVALALEAWEQSFAFYRIWPVLACLAGGVALWRMGNPPSPTAVGEGSGEGGFPALSTVFTIAVWMLVAAIMLVVGIVARLYVRYPLFALPAVSVGSGVALAWLARRGRWGRYAAALLLAFSALTTLLMWYDRIVYAFKPLV